MSQSQSAEQKITIYVATYHDPMDWSTTGIAVKRFRNRADAEDFASRMPQGRVTETAIPRSWLKRYTFCDWSAS